MSFQFDSPAPLLPEILALHGKWRADRVAAICDDEQQNWREFTQSINRAAHALLSHGVQPGDKVVVLMSNGLPMLHALFGIMAAGAVSVPINVSVADDALVGMLQDSGASAVIVSDDYRERMEHAIGQSRHSLRCKLCTTGSSDWLDWAATLAEQPGGPPQVSIQADAELNIIYSSGTTGTPKGIVHTHRGRRDWAYDLSIALRYHSGARTLLSIGLYSNISWVAMLCTLLAGGTVIVARRFDARSFLNTVASHRVTHTAMVPVMFQRVIEQMMQQPDCADVSSMQAMMSCGSPLHETLKRQIFERFPCGIIELYGLTEGIITTLDPEDAEGRWASVGKPLLGTDIQIVDNDNQSVSTGQAGEIVSRGRITMPAYHGRPDATADAAWTDQQGRAWLRSGDIGFIDEQGFLYIVDRKKDMILSGGQNIYPQDIEAVLVDHPGVREVAVIGVKSERWGETPLALIVKADGYDCSAADIIEWCNPRLGKQQRIAAVEFTAELPRNPNGKILKNQLRKEYQHVCINDV